MARALSNPVKLASPEKGVDGRTTLAKARAPVITDGRIGDFWIDTAAQKLYGPKNAAGWPDNGLIKGHKGWSPVFAVVADGNRRVQQVSDWQGGEGTKPATGEYVGAAGLVDNVADAIDIRGVQGPEMLISGIADAAEEIADNSLLPTAQPANDNEKRTVTEIFDLGAVLDRHSVAHAQGSSVRKNIKRIRTQFYNPLYADYKTLVGGADYRRVATEPSHAGKFRTLDRWDPEGNNDSANGGWWELDEPTVTPQMFGAKGDGVADDLLPVLDMIASPFRKVDWLDSSHTYRVTNTLKVTAPNVSWNGSATIRLDRSGTFIVPLVITMGTAEFFYGGDNLVYDHAAEGLPEPAMVSSVAYPMCQCFLHMAPNSHVGGSFLNSFDNGLGIGSGDISGDGTPGNPFNFVQHNSNPVGVSVGRVYGKNCGCGEHTSTPTQSKQGAALNILTADGVRVESIFAEQCYAGLIADYAGGASAVVGTARFKGTKLDSRNAGGTGMDVWVGSALTIGSMYSDNSQGQSVVVFNGAAVLTVGIAYIWATKGTALRVGWGKVSGKFIFGNCGINSPTINSDVVIDVGTGASVLLNLDITSFGPFHTHSYYNNSNPGLVQGSVRVTSYDELTTPVFTRGVEHIETSTPNGGTNIYGGGDNFFAVGGLGIPHTLSPLQVAGGMMLTQAGTTTIGRNCYWDVDAANWKYSITGTAAQRIEFASDGTISEFYAPAGVKGDIVTGANAFVLLFRKYPDGRLVSQLLPNYANDAAAAAGGIIVGGHYRNGSVQMQRAV